MTLVWERRHQKGRQTGGEGRLLLLDKELTEKKKSKIGATASPVTNVKKKKERGGLPNGMPPSRKAKVQKKKIVEDEG